MTGGIHASASFHLVESIFIDPVVHRRRIPERLARARPHTHNYRSSQLSMTAPSRNGRHRHTGRGKPDKPAVDDSNNPPTIYFLLNRSPCKGALFPPFQGKGKVGLHGLHETS